MSELLLELFSEEIPALMQKNAAESYKTIFTTILQDSRLTGDVQVFIGPRRIAVYITNLPKSIPPKEITIRGPKVSSTSQVIEGFCRSNNIEQKNLSTLLVQGQSYYIIVKNTKETDIRVLLEDMIPKAISKYIWPKSMYWGNYDISWIRPLRNILCIFDGEILAIKYGHLTANNITFGHRFISPESITIDSFSEYQIKLRESNVIINQDDRKEIIKSQLLIIAKSLNLVIKEDEKLLEEVTGLVELPVVMVGKIPSHFLKLPSEVLVSSMRNHQKYFSTFDETGNFAPYFLFVSNMPDDQNIIVSGNEKVLSARLSDALYFYQQDLSNSLQSKLPKLERITFHAKLGSVKQKTERIADICNYIIYSNDLENWNVKQGVSERSVHEVREYANTPQFCETNSSKQKSIYPNSLSISDNISTYKSQNLTIPRHNDSSNVQQQLIKTDPHAKVEVLEDDILDLDCNNKPLAKFTSTRESAGGLKPHPSSSTANSVTDSSLAPLPKLPAEVELCKKSNVALGAAKAQMHGTYIISQTADSIIIVDQHAAHERLGYEKIKQMISNNGLIKQRLLMPEIVELPDVKRADLLYNKKDDLSKLGLSLEKFGERSIIVSETPSLLGNTDINQLTQDLADNLSDLGENISLIQLIEHVTETYACHYAIRAGRKLSSEEMNELLRQMEKTPFSGQCNHGRPTYIELKLKDIERLFGRR